MCAGALAIAARMAIGGPNVGVDDANIYMAYGRNLTAGEGLVFYAGGERVEGFTSFAWMLVTASAYLVAPPTPELFLICTAVALIALSVFVLVRFVATAPVTAECPHWLAAGLIGVWCLASPAYAAWMTTSLMETALWSAVLCWGTVAFANLAAVNHRRTRCTAAAICSLAVLVRPEALWIVSIWIATTATVAYAQGQPAGRVWRSVRSAAAAFVITAIALTAFRLLYFGYPLPNTYYAKLSPNAAYNFIEGARYLRGFLVTYPITPFILCGCVAVIGAFGLAAFTRRATKPEWVVVTVSVLAVTTLPLLTGGDHFAGFRVVQPAWPLYAVLLVYGVASLPSPRVRIVAGLVLLLASIVTAAPRWTRDPAVFEMEYDIAVRGRELGRLLNELTVVRSRPSIGVVATGGVATTYRGPVVDLMGLNSVKMGHSTGDRIGHKNHAAFSIPVFWDLEPELVLPRFVPDDRTIALTPRWLSTKNQDFLRGLLNTPRFRDRYRAVVIRNADAAGYPAVFAYCRRDWLSRHADVLRWEDFWALEN